MHIMIATDGALDVDKTVELVARLHTEGDKVSIFTAVPFPRSFLRHYGEIAGVEEVVKIAHETGAGLGFGSGARAAERLTAARPAANEPVPAHNPYFDSVVKECCTPMEEGLTAAGIDAEQIWTSTENQAAKSILAAIDVRDVDLLVTGSHGQGRFEGPLGSTVTKLVRNAPVPVVIVK